MLEGRYHSGESATTYQVRVIVSDEGLTISGDGVGVNWAARDIQVADQHGGAWRLTSRLAPDSRLVIDKGAEIDAALRRLGVTSPVRRAVRHTGFLAGMLALSGAIAALVFVVIPMMAEPLARATPRSVESQLGENLSAQILLIMKPCKGEAAERAETAITPIVMELYAAADPGFSPNLTIVREEQPNAFAMPGGSIMVTSGLLEALDRPEDLEAVLAHEVGHVQARDGMVALYRNAGLGILLEIVTGGSGVAQQIVALGGQLAQLRYTRQQEERADVSAIATLRKAGRDPASLASAFRALKRTISEDPDASGRKPNLRGLKIPEWLQSHPDLDARIARAEAAATPASRPSLLTEADWMTIRAACGR